MKNKIISFNIFGLSAQIVPVGSGSYTKMFPGTDAAGHYPEE